MDNNYTPQEKFLSKEFIFEKKDQADWLTPAMWEGLKDCFRTPICETLSTSLGDMERVVGFVRTLYVDPEDNFVTFEALFWPIFSQKTKEEWENADIKNVEFYPAEQEKNVEKVSVACFII